MTPNRYRFGLWPEFFLLFQVFKLMSGYPQNSNVGSSGVCHADQSKDSNRMDRWFHGECAVVSSKDICGGRARTCAGFNRDTWSDYPLGIERCEETGTD